MTRHSESIVLGEFFTKLLPTRKPEKRGFSLVESVSAIFILLLAVMLTFQLFHTGMQYFHRIEDRTLALSLAEQRLSEVRNWARTHNGWTGFPTGPFAKYPDYQATVTLEDYKLASPCLELDSNYTSKREMTKSCKLATVRVSWHQGSVELFSLVADRDRRWNSTQPIQVNFVSGAPTTIAGGMSVDMKVSATDAASKPIDDLFYNWYVEPVGANGAQATIAQSRDGRTAVLTNLAPDESGTPVPSSGDCRVAVVASYNGIEQWGYSATIHLTP